MRLAFGYIRRSSYKQQENNSVQIQKQHIQEFAKQNQLNVPDEFLFIEDVTSAYSKRANERKELMRLREKMIELKIPIVIFHDVSRMDRTGYSFTIDFYRPLLEKLPDLEVYTTKSKQPINTEDINMKMNFLLFQHESEVKSERALGSLTNALEQESNIRPGSKIPYGYEQINKKLYPNENAKIVSFIFFLYSWGHSLKKIASLLNTGNIPSPSGKQWRSSTIENILKNPVYTGNLTWKIPKRKTGQKFFTFEQTHDPIISEFHLQLYQQNKHLQETFGRFDTPFLFLNKMKCQQCNQILITQNGSTTRNQIVYKYHYYVCKKCQYKMDSHDVHEKLIPLILDRVHQLVSTDEIKESTLEFLNQMIRNLDTLIPSKEKLITNLFEKIAIAREINDRELELKISSVIEQHKHSLTELKNCREHLLKSYETVKSNQFFSRFQTILNHQLSTTEKRLIILYFVDYIFASPESRTNILYKTNIFEELAILSNG
ncbi:recombinase family protein [Bacillus sp. TE8-1]|uniref:recombinase family protein n=1 Tax=Bacillus sp. TE8-1 TaxID=2217829 RepID=UPI0011EF5981|nr:recombinase family protein [Bacillus sp. TE8-1]KAA0761725.1 recombinase family protein [Bacillus sp. TE8-1]